MRMVYFRQTTPQQNLTPQDRLFEGWRGFWGR